MLLICIKIFLARIVDVSLGTIRTVLTVKRKTLIASLIAFVEVFIWFVIAKEALNILVDTLWIPFSYALGYASGTFIGSFISNTLVNDEVYLQIIIEEKDFNILDKIRKLGYGLSVVDLQKSYTNENKGLILVQTKRKNLNKLINLVKKETSNSFMVIDEIQKVK